MENSVHNAFILQKEKSTKKTFNTLYEFCMELIKQLCNQPNPTIEENTNDDAASPPTKVPRCDPPGRLHGGFKIHELALFLATK